MKTAFMITLLLVSAMATAQTGSATEEAITRSLHTLHTAATDEEMQTAVNQLERIALAAPSQWEPHYHYAYAIANLSFREPDTRQKDQLLDRAEKALTQSRKAGGDVSELETLQAFIYQARIMADGSRGMQYSEMAMRALEKALGLNPDNPRAQYLLGMNILHTPEPFGGGKANALPWLQKAVDNFQSQQVDSPIYPSWGEQAARHVLARSKKQE
jgi:tetratricopeptide (TPR) repeat protein